MVYLWHLLRWPMRERFLDWTRPFPMCWCQGWCIECQLCWEWSLPLPSNKKKIQLSTYLFSQTWSQKCILTFNSQLSFHWNIKDSCKMCSAIPYPRLWGCRRRKRWRWVEWLQEAWKPAMRWWCRAALRREDGARWLWPANRGDILLALPDSSYIFEKRNSMGIVGLLCALTIEARMGRNSVVVAVLLEHSVNVPTRKHSIREMAKGGMLLSGARLWPSHFDSPDTYTKQTKTSWHYYITSK